MEKNLAGQAFVFGKNIDTDQIYPGRFVELTEENDIKQYAMYGADEKFLEKFHAGDIIVAGTNFGCGSSREHAAITLRAIGVGAVVAESFGRIFFRNAINLGIPALICPNISALVNTGDQLKIDLENGTIQNVTTGKTAKFEPMSEYIFHILESGGIKPMIKAMLAK